MQIYKEQFEPRRRRDIKNKWWDAEGVTMHLWDYQGMGTKSIDAHLKAMKIRNKLFGETSVEIIESYTGLGNAYREKREYTTSLEYFEKALKNKIIQHGEAHSDLRKYFKNISDVYYLMENKVQGDFYKRKSEEIFKN